MRVLRDGEVSQMTFGENFGITWIPWVKNQENALMVRIGRRTWRFGFKYSKNLTGLVGLSAA
jgi:hypothetical protein